MTIAIDFDGTCVTHEFPAIGKDIGAVNVLKTLVENGHHLILNTMRSHKLYEGKDTLQEALDWFNNNKIQLFGIGENPTQKNWTDTTKPYAHFYIDDANLGAPLIKDCPTVYRPFIDWKYIILELEKVGALLPDDVSRLMNHVINAQSNLTLL